MIVRTLALGSMALLAGAASSAEMAAPPSRAPAVAPSRVATLLRQMTLDEKVRIVTGMMGTAGLPGGSAPSTARGGDGFVPGVPRLGIPDINLIGAGLGVTSFKRANGQSTALPSSLALASSFDPALSYAYGSVIGDETKREGFNVSLGGGVDLQREPRGGRAFEYHGEDPILAGRIVAAQLRGIEAQGVVATIKHYALNDFDNGRFAVDIVMDERAMREAELLAFEIGIKESGVGAVMCSYNLVNGVYACENPYLLNQVLKQEWGFKGWVMSDWGATHSTTAANAGLDQEFFSGEHFGPALKAAVEKGTVPQARLDDMVVRILSQLERVGALKAANAPRPIDVRKGAAVALRTAETGSVLLKNEGILPLNPSAGGTIAVIGFNADKGVLSGGGSAQVDPVGGNAVPMGQEPAPGDIINFFRRQVWDPSAPLAAIRTLAKETTVLWDPGSDPVAAAATAAKADTVIVFAGRHRHENEDIPDLTLGNDQEAMIAAVAKANPKTIVVLETGGAHTMPWIGQVQAVLEAWYPGQKGGEAIANILFGNVNPSGKLPLSFPLAESDLARPKAPGPVLKDGATMQDMFQISRFSVAYNEGALLGYKWFDARNKPVLFPFGFGLSYTTFAYADIQASIASKSQVSLQITNTGKRAGTEIAQVYVSVPGSGVPRRLAGWARVELAPGARQRVAATLEPKALANWDVARKRWVMPAGDYEISVGSSSRDLKLKAKVRLTAERVLP